jgi:hypothetical protein
MKFTPGQTQEILRLSPATFRHWKRALPPLFGRNGYAPCFTAGDLLALAAVKVLADDVGIRVGSLCAVSVSLFEHCQHNAWASLERSTLMIDPVHGRVNSLPEAQRAPIGEMSIILPWRPIITALRERLLMEKIEPPQGNLRFPPAMVANHQKREGAS